MQTVSGQAHTFCGACTIPLHHKCLNLSETEIKILQSSKSSNLKIFCNQCKITVTTLSQMKKMIADLKSTVDTRLRSIETLVQSSKLCVAEKEEIIEEAVERSIRASNVILYNVPEDPNENDATIANDILEIIDPTAVVAPDAVFRVGRLVTNKIRPLKLCMRNADLARLVFRKKSALRNTKFNNIRVSSDKTRSQQNYFRELKEELKIRQDNGEKNLIIRYTNNIPQIVHKSPLGDNSNRTDTSEN